MAAKVTKKAKRQSPKASKKVQKSEKNGEGSRSASATPQKASGNERKFKLSPSELKEVKASGNPYRPSSSYAAVVDGLRTLGVGKLHAWEAVVTAVVAAMGEGAKTFKARKPRNDNGLDWKDRVITNVKTVIRPDYGAKLRQVGFEVRTDGKNGAGIYKL